mmetsp:Transcript_17735/g.44013  ORF Transcript_17735/g.44013 Transcript_17735/m.44013 type:complete len:395 (+) Transcript_17735:219-1403(+)
MKKETAARAPLDLEQGEATHTATLHCSKQHIIEAHDRTHFNRSKTRSVKLLLSRIGENLKKTTDPDSVSRKRRILLVLSCLFFQGLTCGSWYGYQAVLPFFIRSGAYGSLCNTTTISNAQVTKNETLPHFYSNASNPLSSEDQGCREQRFQLLGLFTTAMSITPLVSMFLGILADVCGPKLSSTVGNMLITIGSGMIALAALNGWEAAYLPSYLAISLGTNMVFLPSFHLASALENKAIVSIITAGIPALFDLSSISFVVIGEVVKAMDGGLPDFFLIFGALPLLFTFISLLHPLRPFSRPKLQQSSGGRTTHLFKKVNRVSPLPTPWGAQRDCDHPCTEAASSMSSTPSSPSAGCDLRATIRQAAAARQRLRPQECHHHARLSCKRLLKERKR